jgi:hypothetical protein
MILNTSLYLDSNLLSEFEKSSFEKVLNSEEITFPSNYNGCIKLDFCTATKLFCVGFYYSQSSSFHDMTSFADYHNESTDLIINEISIFFVNIFEKNLFISICKQEEIDYFHFNDSISLKKISSLSFLKLGFYYGQSTPYNDLSHLTIQRL